MSARMASSGARAPTLLVIDDDPVLRTALQAALSGAGFDVHVAPDGPEGVEGVSLHAPDLVLLDIMMPGMDGFEVCRTIRGLPGGERVSVVMMTGLDDTGSIQTAYDAGATDFLTKPINYLLLRHHVDYILRAKHTADALHRSQARLSTAQRIARIGHWEWDVREGTSYFSEGFAALYDAGGRTPPECLESFLRGTIEADRARTREALAQAMAAGGDYSLEQRTLRPDGTEGVLYQEGRFMLDEDGVVCHGVGTVQDITSWRRSEERVRYLTYYDGLTGLPNRDFLRDHVARCVAASSRAGRAFAVVLIGLDHFKRINETMGFKVGDALLREVADRLRGSVRTSDALYRDGRPGSIVPGERHDTLARFGGDEFVLVLTEIQRPEDAVLVAERIFATLAAPFEVEGESLHVSASVGITVHPVDGDEPDLLLERAQAAMHQAKTQGRARHSCYSQEVEDCARRKFRIERELRAATEEQSLEVYFQPRFDLARGRVAGMEALARWHHPELGEIAPTEFIAVAEECGLIHEVGRWVTERACMLTREWQRAGLDDLKVSINLSPAQFRDERLCQTVMQTLERCDLAGEHVEFELTESMLLEDLAGSVATLRALREMGVGIAIDDFGTGYSSLNYLVRYPLTTLKVDRAFIVDVARTREAASVVNAIISLGHGLGLTVVAEGIEQPEQLKFLESRGCDEAQGFYICRPLPPEEFREWVRLHASECASLTGPKHSRPASDGHAPEPAPSLNDDQLPGARPRARRTA